MSRSLDCFQKALWGIGSSERYFFQPEGVNMSQEIVPQRQSKD